MSSPEYKDKHNKRIRNKYAKALFDQNELKGAFSLKVHDARKGEYKRKKIKVTEVFNEED
jgi:hypothetical protein